MVTAAKTVSQIGTHMSVAFAITYVITGSMAFGGLAALLEPVINVMLLPLHEKIWARILRARQVAINHGQFSAASFGIAAKKGSQVGLHMSVAFAVMYWATGSAAIGGLAAVLEPVCNVILLPFHDNLWEKIRSRVEAGSGPSTALA